MDKEIKVKMTVGADLAPKSLTDAMEEMWKTYKIEPPYYLEYKQSQVRSLDLFVKLKILSSAGVLKLCPIVEEAGTPDEWQLFVKGFSLYSPGA